MLATSGDRQNAPPAQRRDRLWPRALLALTAQTDTQLAAAVVAPSPELPFRVSDDRERVIGAARQCAHAVAR